MEESIEKGSMSLVGNKLTIFGDWGMPKDGTWIVPCPGPTGSVTEINPCPVSSTIEDVLNEDIRNGVAGKIDRIQVDTHTAIMLFLEEKITKDDVRSAVADDASVTFQPVTFSTKKGAMTLPVVVTIDAEYAIATLDVDGNII